MIKISNIANIYTLWQNTLALVAPIVLNYCNPIKNLK